MLGERWYLGDPKPPLSHYELEISATQEGYSVYASSWRNCCWISALVIGMTMAAFHICHPLLHVPSVSTYSTGHSMAQRMRNRTVCNISLIVVCE